MLTLKWIVAACALLAAAPPQPGNKRNAQVDTELKRMFDKVDLDHDSYLDRAELTRFYRGAKAKPVEGNMYDDMGNLSPLYYQAQRKYPELVFLWTVDTDGDGRVSWPEYRVYGEKRIAALRQQQQALQQALRAASRRALRNNSTSNRRTSRTAANYNRRNARQVRNLQRAAAAQRRQANRQIQNWQRSQVAAQQAYQSALRRQWQAQQRRANYVRARVAAFYRTPRRHFNPAAFRRRRR